MSAEKGLRGLWDAVDDEPFAGGAEVVDMI
jgi:hypothetical protein